MEPVSVMGTPVRLIKGEGFAPRTVSATRGSLTKIQTFNMQPTGMAPSLRDPLFMQTHTLHARGPTNLTPAVCWLQHNTPSHSSQVPLVQVGSVQEEFTLLWS